MKINLLAPINSLSFGIWGINILKSLVKLGHEVSLFPIGSVEFCQEDENYVRDSIKNQNNFDVNAPSIRIFHNFSLAEHTSKKARIGVTLHELDYFDDKELCHMKSQDLLFVPSQWSVDVLSKYGINAKISHLGVDRNIFYEEESEYSTNEKATVFFNLSKWEIRKSHDILWEAFNNAFTRNDNVKLIMCNHNFFISQEHIARWESLYKRSPLGDRIEILRRLPTQYDIADVIRRGDCGVYPSKAEGFNLPALETLSCGKQLIITNCTAHTEFCNKDNSFLIEMKDMESAYDGVFFNGSKGNWYSFGKDQMEQLICHMRKIHKLKQTDQLKVNRNGIDTAIQFSWENAAKQIVNGIEEIRECVY